MSHRIWPEFFLMKFVKYFVGSLIISGGIVLLLAIFTRGMQLTVPGYIADHLLFIWIGLAVVISPFAPKIIRT